MHMIKNCTLYEYVLYKLYTFGKNLYLLYTLGVHSMLMIVNYTLKKYVLYKLYTLGVKSLHTIQLRYIDIIVHIYSIQTAQF